MPSLNGRIKTNRLAIYLIKQEFQTLEDIVEPGVQTQLIQGVGTFVFQASHTNTPDWVRDFFGDDLGRDLPIFSASARGMLIVPVTRNRNISFFAVSFGTGRFLLKEGVTEERFGLKLVLNSAAENGFRSIDKTTLGSVPKHSREQMSRDVPPSDFGIDVEQDLVGLVAARSKDDRFGKIIIGRDSFNLSAKVDATNIVDFLTYCLERYASDDYKQNFGWIDQISEVRNRKTEEGLNAALITKINANDLEKVWMAVPEVVNWSDISTFRYQQAKRGEDQDDLDMPKFIETFEGRPVTLEDLKYADVFAISASHDDFIHKWQAFKCIYAEIPLDGKVYILNNGRWYEIAKDFTDEVERDFTSIPDSTISLPEYVAGDEFSYNKAATTSLGNACCMDRQLVHHGGPHGQVEFCDIFTSDNKIIHVKKYGGSSVLSHLFSQGLVSGELFLGEAEFRKKLNAKLPRGYKLANSVPKPVPQEYEIIYAIISKSTNPLDIPFFSKVSLRNARRRLTNYGYTVTKKKIQKVDATATDEVDE